MFLPTRCVLNSHAILFYFRAEEGAFNQKEQENFTNFCDALASELLPYLNKCLQSLFPPMQLAQTLGLTVQDLAKLVRNFKGQELNITFSVF